jgi:4-hydroxybenzoate polyprenyltransferase
VAVTAAAFLIVACWWDPIPFSRLAIISAIYFLLNLAYSKWLKHIPLLDVMIIATGFVLRVAAGVSVIHVQRFSPGFMW